MPRPVVQSPKSILDLFKQVDISRKVPASLQIRDVVRFAVASGKLQSGDRLPSMKELAAAMHVNQTVVMQAYRDLDLLKIVVSRRGLGVYIREDAARLCKRECRAEVVQRIFEAASQASACGIDAAELTKALNASLKSADGLFGKAPAQLLRQFGGN